MEDVADLFRACSRACQAQDGRTLAAQLSALAPGPLPGRAQSCCAAPALDFQIDSAARSILGERWGPIAAAQLRGRASLNAGDMERSYSMLVAAYNGLINAMRDETAWVVPVLRVMTYEARIVADRADADRAKRARPGDRDATSGRNDSLRDVEKTLKKGFSACWNDRGAQDSKKRATLYVVAQLMKIYFKLNLLKLAQPMIRPIEATVGKQGLLDGNRAFPQGDVVAYRFFVGRLRLFEDQYAAAEDHLAYAFAHCPKDARANKRAILEFLLTVRLLRGAFPRPRLLEKHGLQTLAPIVEAVRKGDLKTFDEEMRRNMMTLVRRGTFLLLEKAKVLAYRNLFKRVYLVRDRAPHMKIADFKRALDWLGNETEIGEVECIIANLIFKKLVKGYIAHTKGILVLSKKDPFPTDAVKACWSN